ncbi:MAG TPA: hypothetical protein VGS18_04495, partial [Thermoplasmata archaeon]|nr:hypothetical protein [Thermoplasmata archaeon]
MAARQWGITLDTKRELTFPNTPIVERGSTALDLTRGRKGGNVIYRPSTLWDVELIFRAMLAEGGRTIAVDEAYMITTSPGNSAPGTFPPSYILGLTRGRSKKGTVVTATQRPRFLPLFAMTEASHFFIFEPGSSDDAKYL